MTHGGNVELVARRLRRLNLTRRRLMFPKEPPRAPKKMSRNRPKNASGLRPPCSFVRRGLRLAMLVALVVPLGAIASIEALFAPRAELWQRWTAHDPAAAAAIDHAPWDRFAKTYVKPQPDGVNRVAYARVSAADRKALADYVAGLAGTPISAYRREQQLAYWLNLYNALTVNLVLDHYPVASIRDIDISPGWFSDGPWTIREKVVYCSRFKGRWAMFDFNWAY